MPTALTIRDATSWFSSQQESLTLDIATARITVKELIHARVYQEVRVYNDHQPEYFRGLVQPRAAEQTLNGFKLPLRHQIDPEQQFTQAIAAFTANAFFILVDDMQVDDLDELIEIRPRTSVTFLKLVPLVGG